MRKNHIFSQELVFKMAHELKRQGKTVCLTHGAYDLFHYGHLDFLTQSAEKCDFLIVGVESDESLKTYKNEHRPIISERERLNIISSLSVVDAVFIKDEYQLAEGPLRDLYEEISPNFITIGRKFTGEDVIRDTAYEARTQVKFIDNSYLQSSTSEIIERILKKYNKVGDRRRQRPPIVERK